MSFFYNKEIKELQNKIDQLESKLKDLEADNKNLSIKLSDFDKKNEILKNNLKKTNDEMMLLLKPWKEYEKWEKMKKDLPDLEEMYDLKKLKLFITALPKLKLKELGYQFDYAESLNSRKSLRRDSSGHFIKDPQVYKKYIEIITREIDKTENGIRRILEKLRKHRKNKELVGLFKLYAISTDWLKP
tara:strand:- start:798 stop:1358 length:561 start_codon:yes stop_codon:yes gene_type:complete